MPHDTLRLLGAFHLVHRGGLVTMGQARLEELVALLATRPGMPIARRQIAFQFWPDSSEKQAHTNTRNLLYKLKKAWPAVNDAITIDSANVLWRQDAPIDVDVQRFEALCAQAAASDDAGERIRLLTAAAESSGGDLLPGCYAEWALAAREQLRAHYAAVLEELTNALIDRRQYTEAIAWARQLLDDDPLRESTYRLLMRAHAVRGDRAAALRVYHNCASMLRKELGVEPSRVTEKLHARLLEHDVDQAHDSNAPKPAPRPQLVGRHPEWRQLQQVWSEVEQGQARCVVIWGEAGIGKTRLAEELIDWVKRQGQAWASSRAYATAGALTYASITEWLRAARVFPAVERVDDLWRVELARLLPSLLVDRPDLPPPGPLTETWQQQRFFQGLVNALRAVQGPLLLHLDDMQWSDQETLTFLQFLLHSARTYPLLIVGAVRTEDAGGNGALAALLDGVRHNNQLVEMCLQPLSADETVALAEQTAGETITRVQADALSAASEGHPLFLIETVRAGLTEAVSSNIDANSSAVPSGVQGVTAMPPKIYDLLSARLDQLSSDAKRVVSAAAVIGRDFTYEMLHAATSMAELRLVDALDELWTRQIVREQGGDSYDFSHDRIREVAYQEISRARRRLIHGRVAVALKTIHGDDLDEVAGELAAHYAQAGDSEHAFRTYWRAAKVALLQHALTLAETMLDAALAHAPDDPIVRIELLGDQSTVYRKSLQFDNWRENLDEQQARLVAISNPDPSITLKIELDRSRYFGAIGEGKAAADTARTAITMAKGLNDTIALARCYQELGHAFWLRTRMAEASESFGQSVHYARLALTPDAGAISLEMQAATGMFSGMPMSQIMELLTFAYDIATTNGDKEQMASLLNKFGYGEVSKGMGGFDRSEQKYQRSLALAREIGHIGTEDMVLSNLGVLYTNRGDYRQALAALNASLAMGEGVVGYQRYWMTRHYFGHCLMQMGCFDDAQRALSAASEQLQNAGNRHFEVKARCDLGLLYHLTGEQQLAHDELAKVRTLIQGYGDTRFEAHVCTRLGYVLEATGQSDKAQIMYEQGYSLHNKMEQDYYALNALAGLARIAAQRGDEQAAFDHAEAIWETLAGKETDVTVETTRTLRTCYSLFCRYDDPRAELVYETACEQLRRRVATIDDPTHRTQFWQLDDHRYFQRAAENYQ